MTVNEAVKLAMARNVLVTTENYKASGVIITSGVVMTCFHCLETLSDVKVNDTDAEIVAVDPKNDMCLLNVATLPMDTVRLGDASIGEPVLTVGNPLRLVNALLIGRVVKKEDNSLYHDTHVMLGVSGSGLYTFEGVLVGLNRACYGTRIGSHLAIATPAEHMGFVLSQVFHIVQPSAEEVQKFGNPQEEDLEG